MSVNVCVCVSGKQTLCHRTGTSGSVPRVCVAFPPLLQYHLRTTWRNSGCGDGHVNLTYIFSIQLGPSKTTKTRCEWRNWLWFLGGKQPETQCVCLSLCLAWSRCPSCQCERYVSAEELCNTSCLSRLPQLSAQLLPDGHLLLSLKERNSMVWARVRERWQTDDWLHLTR